MGKYKKQIKSLLLAAALLLTLCFAAACGAGTDAEENRGQHYEAEQSEQPEDTETVTETEEVSEEPTEILDFPILDEIDENMTVGTAGSSLRAVAEAVKLLDWGTATGLDPEEIRQVTAAWLSDKGNDEQMEFAEKLQAVDGAYQQLLGSDNAETESLLDAAGCADAAYPWSDEPVESIEAIMEAAGLR